MEAGQRLGRLAYEIVGKETPGAHHVLMTAEEYRRYGKRLLIYEQWGLDIDVRVEGGAVGRPARAVSRRSARAQAKAKPAAMAPAVPQEKDEISQTLSIPGVKARLGKAAALVGKRTAPYLPRVFRFCYNAAFRAEEITEGLGISDLATVSRFRSACKALLQVGLFTDAGDGRFTVNQAEISRLRALARAVG